MAGGDRHLTELFLEAGIREMTEVTLPVAVEHATFAAQWEPFTLGVGLAGEYLRSLDHDGQAA